MYGVIEAINETRKALYGTNVEDIEIGNLTDMMVFESKRAGIVIDFLHDCERIDYIQRDRLHEILENCDHSED